MEIIGKKHLEKLKSKNKGNILLNNAIDKLFDDLKDSNWDNKLDLINDRPDANCVYDDFYFFDLNIHRVFILIEFEDDESTIVGVEIMMNMKLHLKTIKILSRNG